MSAAHVQSAIALLLFLALIAVIIAAWSAAEGRVAESLIAQADTDTWPRRTHDGRTVWACCESNIGPACAHVQQR